MIFDCCHAGLLSSPRENTKFSGFSVAHIKDLGRGAFGTVDQVRLWPTGPSLARKSIRTSTKRKSKRKGPFHEIVIMRRMQHPNIVKIVAAYRERESINILMSPVADCNLKEFLSDPDRWPEKQPSLIRWFAPLASAMRHLHDRPFPVTHHDIKPSNILLDGTRIVLADFGLSSFSASDTRSDQCFKAFGTPAYQAPEIASGEQANAIDGPKVDVWSLGCVFAEMATVLVGRSLTDLRHHIRFDQDRTRHEKTYHRHRAELLDWLLSLQIITNAPYEQSIIQLCEKMLHCDPSERPSAQDVSIICDAGGGTVDLVPYQVQHLALMPGMPRIGKVALALAYAHPSSDTWMHLLANGHHHSEYLLARLSALYRQIPSAQKVPSKNG